LWTAALALVGFLAAWPFVGEMVAANDDVGFVRDERYNGTLWQGIANSWSKASVFRPIDVMAGKLCDATTLECWGVPVVQIAGLLAVLIGLAMVTRRLFPGNRAALPVLVIWLAMSPATTVSLWQLDSCSQTWSAACGVWMGLLTWLAIDAARAGRALWPRVAGLSVFVVIAVNTKELMYGWAFGIGLVLLGVIAHSAMQRDWRLAMRGAWLTLPVIVLPMLHLAVRLKFSGLARTMERGETGVSEARYQASLGLNLLQNIWLSLLGLFGNGPVHLIDDAAAPLPLRGLTLASLMGVFVALASAAVLAIAHGRVGSEMRSRRIALLLCAAAGLLSVSVTLPMGQVSELYGMGANAASGLLIVAAVTSLWNPIRAEERTLCRIIAMLCAALILIPGLYGVVSRAHHFRISWGYAREMNRMLLEHQDSIEPAPDPSLVVVTQSCISGRVHSQYLVTPLQAVGFEGTLRWLNDRDPSRRVLFVNHTAMSRPGPRDLLLRCEQLPQRGHW
jgi:hypothetical protein